MASASRPEDRPAPIAFSAPWFDEAEARRVTGALAGGGGGGVGRDEEVVCPSFTCVSTANATLRVGARPVFADIAEDALGLDPADVERCLGPRTAALLPIHYAGVAPDMDRLLALAGASH